MVLEDLFNEPQLLNLSKFTAFYVQDDCVYGVMDNGTCLCIYDAAECRYDVERPEWAVNSDMWNDKDLWLHLYFMSCKAVIQAVQEKGEGWFKMPENIMSKELENLKSSEDEFGRDLYQELITQDSDNSL